jgi:mRNA interferase RelE/StbE
MKNSSAYKVVFLSKAERFYKELYFSDRTHFDRITQVLESLKGNPFQGKPLKHSLKGKYSLRVGMYRIIYTTEKHKMTVYILKIGHRRDVYR